MVRNHKKDERIACYELLKGIIWKSVLRTISSNVKIWSLDKELMKEVEKIYREYEAVMFFYGDCHKNEVEKYTGRQVYALLRDLGWKRIKNMWTYVGD